MIKPNIFWRHYPSLGHGYWCVSHSPKPATPDQRQLWEYAHRMKHEMNEQEAQRRATALRDKFNEAYPAIADWWDGIKDAVASQGIPRRMLDEPGDSPEFREYLARLEARTAGDFKLLYMQEPFPDADDAREQARAGQRKRTAGRRDDLDLSERASRDPNDPRGRLK